MAIGANASVLFAGTQDEVSFNSTIASAAVQALDSAGSPWTNDDDAPFASFVLEFAMSTAAPDEWIHLRAALQDTENGNTASDEPPPTTSNTSFGRYLGSFRVTTGTGTQFVPLTSPHGLGFVPLPVAELQQAYVFYLHNATGQQIASTPNPTLHITPIAFGPHA